jgi:hypothetical protein
MSLKPEHAAVKLGSDMRAWGFTEVILAEDCFDRQNDSRIIYEEPYSQGLTTYWTEDFPQEFREEEFKFTCMK